MVTPVPPKIRPEGCHGARQAAFHNDASKSPHASSLQCHQVQSVPCPSVLPEEDVGDEGQEAGRQHADDALVDGDGALQGVDALLHGVGVDVVVDGDADAPHGPHGVHHRLHGGGHHPDARRRPPNAGPLPAPKTDTLKGQKPTGERQLQQNILQLLIEIMMIASQRVIIRTEQGQLPKVHRKEGFIN